MHLQKELGNHCNLMISRLSLHIGLVMRFKNSVLSPHCCRWDRKFSSILRNRSTGYRKSALHELFRQLLVRVWFLLRFHFNQFLQNRNDFRFACIYLFIHCCREKIRHRKRSMAAGNILFVNRSGDCRRRNVQPVCQLRHCNWQNIIGLPLEKSRLFPRNCLCTHQ